MKLIKFLLKFVKDKNFNFSIDSDKDGQPFIEGKINLAELVDEASRFAK